MVIWITGLSASGKSTLSNAFKNKYGSDIPNMVLLDGDIIRDLFGNDLGHTESDRVIQIQRIQKLALFLEQQSINVVVAALYANDELLANNRKTFKDYYEVYLKGEIQYLKTREFKNLYKQALDGKITDVVGVDIKWNEPNNPDLVFEISKSGTPEEMAAILFENLNTRK